MQLLQAAAGEYVFARAIARLVSLETRGDDSNREHKRTPPIIIPLRCKLVITKTLWIFYI
jgi:hypothetical protein